jgi:hypothetical protein
VAETLTAQYTPQEATVTPQPSETPTQFVAPTLAATQPLLFATATLSQCDNSIYVDDITYKDGTIVAPSTAFTKTWSIRNTGTCTWTATYKIKFDSGAQMGGTTTAIGKTVAPGEAIEVSVAMTSPATAGPYIGYWRMINDSGVSFGQTVNINISVGAASTGTITTTPTVTKTPTVTPVYIVVTATPAPTNTTAPTATETTTGG